MRTQARIRAENLRRRKKRTDAAVDLLKTVMIYALTVSMLALAGLYINDRQNAGQAGEIPEEKMSIFEGGSDPGEIDERQISPVNITVTVEGSSFTAVYGDTASDIYGNFKDFVMDIFAPGSQCVKLNSEEGEKVWRECTRESNSVYIKYAGNYLYPVISAFLDKDRESIALSEELAMVRELFIVDRTPVYGVARDIYGNISLFMPEEEAGAIIRDGLNTASLESAYNNIVELMIPGEFLKGEDISVKTGANRNGIKNLKFPDAFLLFRNYATYSAVLRFANPLLGEDGNIDTNQVFIGELFKLLNFNIENSGPPRSDRNGIIFSDRRTSVRFHGDGLIIYNGGIHLSKFLGYGAARRYTFYDKIKAASVFAGRLPPELTGNVSGLYLTGISSKGEESLTFTFGYYYGGIGIKINGGRDGVIIETDGNNITEVRINSLNVSANPSPDNIIKNRNPILELGIIDGMISRETEENGIEETAEKYKLAYDKIQDKFIVNEFEPVYNIDYSRNAGLPVAAERELR